MKNLNYLILTVVILAIALPSCQQSHQELLEENAQVSSKYSSAVNQQIAQLRQVTSQYHDSEAAVAAGYENSFVCFTGPAGMGDMGVHFINQSLIDGTFDPLEPEALVYEIKSDGSYKLVAVEYLFIGADAPEFAGEIAFHPLALNIADYALHVWAWKANPAGIFEDWNINVTCP